MRALVRSAASAFMLLAAGGLCVSDAGAQQRGSRPSIPVRLVRAAYSPITVVISGSRPAPSAAAVAPQGPMRIAVGRMPTGALAPTGNTARTVTTGPPNVATRDVVPSNFAAPNVAPSTGPVDLYLDSGRGSADPQLVGVREYLDRREQSTPAMTRSGGGPVQISLDSGVPVDPSTLANEAAAGEPPPSYDRGYIQPNAPAEIVPGATASGSAPTQFSNRPLSAADGEYRLGPGDVVDVFVWRNADLSRTVPVRPDGYISLPLAGEIIAAGKSAVELEAEITGALREYVQVPTVTITVTQIRSLVIYVLGRVAQPGPLTLERNVDIVQAIAMAGGVTEFADKNGVHVIRTVRGRRVRVPFPYGDVLKGKLDGGQLVLQAGDVIYVP